MKPFQHSRTLPTSFFPFSKRIFCYWNLIWVPPAGLKWTWKWDGFTRLANMYWLRIWKCNRLNNHFKKNHKFIVFWNIYLFFKYLLHENTVTVWKGDSVTMWQYDSVTVWQSDVVTKLQRDKVTVWQCDSVKVWHCDSGTVGQCDSVTVWQCDNVTVWQCDSDTVWQCKSVLRLTLPLRGSCAWLPLYIHQQWGSLLNQFSSLCCS